MAGTPVERQMVESPIPPDLGPRTGAFIKRHLPSWAEPFLFRTAVPGKSRTTTFKERTEKALTVVTITPVPDSAVVEMELESFDGHNSRRFRVSARFADVPGWSFGKAEFFDNKNYPLPSSRDEEAIGDAEEAFGL